MGKMPSFTSHTIVLDLSTPVFAALRLERFRTWKAILHCAYGGLSIDDSSRTVAHHAKNIKLHPFDRRLQDKSKLSFSIFHLESRFLRNPVWSKTAP